MLHCWQLIAAACLCQVHAVLVKQSLESVDPHAVCMDGTPAAYYWKAAEPISLRCSECEAQGYRKDACGCGYCSSDGGCSYTCGKNSSRWPQGPACELDNSSLAASSTWIVYLQGGGWCYDLASCNSRCGTPQNPDTSSPLCSSKGYASTSDESGIFWDYHPDMQRANKVFVNYCTSDGHMGNTTNFGWNFRGHAVVHAVLRDLVARHGLGSGLRKDTLLFGGGSAGARGAMVHLDYVAKMLGGAAANINVLGFLDSPAWIDMPPFSENFPGFANITKAVYSYANVLHVGTECAAKYAGEEWKCLFGQYRLPTISTKYFLVASQADSYQLGNSVGHEPKSSAELAYALDFANKTRGLLSSIREATTGCGLFSWSCFNHCTSTRESGFRTLTAAGSSMSAALAKWLGFAPTDGVNPSWIDSCSGFACGAGCSAAASTLQATFTASLPIITVI